MKRVKLLEKIAGLIDRINEWVGTGVSWLTTAMVVVVCYDVFTRYVLRKSSVAVQELEWHLFAVIFLLAAGYTLRHDKHVRVDVFYAKLSRKKKALIDLAGTVIFLIPFTVLVIWSSLGFVENSFRIMESSPDPGGLPFRYLLKACIPVGFVLLLLQALSLLIKSLMTIFEGEVKGSDG